MIPRTFLLALVTGVLLMTATAVHAEDDST